jgi:hypothetical protein
LQLIGERHGARVPDLGRRNAEAPAGAGASNRRRRRSELLLLLLNDLHQRLLDLLLILAGLLRNRLHELIGVALALLKILLLKTREHLLQLRLDLLEVLLQVLLRLLIDHETPFRRPNLGLPAAGPDRNACKVQELFGVGRRPQRVVRYGDAARAAIDVAVVAPFYARA